MRYLDGFKRKSLIALFFKLVEAIFELFLPILMVSLIDKGIEVQSMDHIKKMVMLMLLFSILGYISSLICQYLASVVSQQVGASLRRDIFKKINTFSLEETDRFSSAKLTTRVTTDVNQVQEMVAKTIRLAIRTPLIIIGSLFALYTLNHDLGIKLIMTVPVFVIVVVFFMKRSMEEHNKAQIILEKVSAKAKEMLSGVRIIRAFSQTEAENKRFKVLNHNLAQQQRRVGLITTLSSPLTSFLMNCVLVGLVYVGAVHIQEGSMSQGQMVAVISYCTQMVFALIVFMNLVMIFSRGVISSRRINEVLETVSTMDMNGSVLLPDHEPLSIQFNNVSFSYPETKRSVVSNVSMTIEKGMVVGIIGLTGSGKSSMVKLLPRFYDATQGNVSINGMDIRDYDVNSLRSQIGYVSQSAAFLKGSIADNISMGMPCDVKKALYHAEGSEIIDKGLDTIIEERGSNLSGGQRQRVSIARALAKNPGLLIFDDAFSALDYLTDKRLRTNIKEYYPDTTQIVISQRVTSVMHADCIYVMDQGILVASGNHETLLDTNDVYRQIFKLQQEVTA